MNNTFRRTVLDLTNAEITELFNLLYDSTKENTFSIQEIIRTTLGVQIICKPHTAEPSVCLMVMIYDEAEIKYHTTYPSDCYGLYVPTDIILFGLYEFYKELHRKLGETNVSTQI